MLNEGGAEAPPVLRPSIRDDDESVQLKRSALGGANSFGATTDAPLTQIRRRSWVSSYSNDSDQKLAANRRSTNTNTNNANQSGDEDDSSRRRNSLLGSIYSMRSGNNNGASLKELPTQVGAFYVRSHNIGRTPAPARSTSSLYPDPGELEQLRPLSQGQSNLEDEHEEIFAATRSFPAQAKEEERPKGEKEAIFHGDGPPDVITIGAVQWNRSSKNRAPSCLISVLLLSLLIAGMVALLQSNFTRPKPDPPPKDSTNSITHNCDHPSEPGDIIQTQRYKILKEVLELKLDASILEDPCSPHASALKWLADEDTLLKVAPMSHSDVHQRFAVALWYYSTNMGETDVSPDLNKVNEPWLTQEQECLWHGITCQYDGGGDGALITHIELGSIELSGSIPDEFVTLLPNLSTYMRLPETHLDLSQNLLTGTIPKCLYSSSTLVNLNLGRNTLSGPIDAYEWTSWNMEKMALAFNMFNGTIPTSLGSLSNIQMLDLSRNELDGSISEEIMNLAGLKILHLADNKLNGSIPVEMGNMTGLQYLFLVANYLTGNIPAEFSKLKSLFYVDVRMNQMSGMVPYAICKLREENLQSIMIDCHGAMECACCANC
eukprot:scaffold24561_cov64-Attheya_sp.AAC.5